MKRTTRGLLFVIVVFVSSGLLVARAQPAPSTTREISNTAAFARLYGVMRFFYPGDAAASLNWNRVAVDGVARVRTAPDSDALAAELRAMFAQLGPGIEIAASLSAYRAPAASAEPLVAWRYTGAGAADRVTSSAYAAKRTGREQRAAITGFTGFAQAFAAPDVRGRAIRLRAQARATAHDALSGGALWLRVDHGTQSPAFFDNMSDRLIRDAVWREYSIVGTVSADATSIVFGVMVNGAATAYFDALELAVQDADGTWRALPIKDAGFEADAGDPSWNRVGTANAQVNRVAEDAREGRQFVRISPTAPMSAAELFADAAPAIGDHIDVDLGGGVRARVTLALTDTQAKSRATVATPAPHASDLDERLADVVVAWNFYRHFYPYFTDAAVDWDARLQPQLLAAYQATTRDGEADALRRLVADARDGHGHVTDTRGRNMVNMVNVVNMVGTLPVQVALVESQVVVAATRDAAIPAGAVVTAIDGAPARDRFEALVGLQSGSGQWRPFAASQELVMCTSGTPVKLIIDNGRGAVDRVVRCEGLERPAEKRPPQTSELSPGVWYVDITRAKTADVTPILGSLAKARAVIFDVRGYPTDAGLEILPHLIGAPEHDRWMHVAKIAGPFGRTAGWVDEGWDLQPAAPKLSGKIVFLTDGRAISYAESVMGYIHDRHLATIIGSTTAGTNGNIATFGVPGGFSIIFTGMRVTGHDGQSVHHLVGVKPDVPVVPTIAGLRAGKDEVLERALSLVQ
jgi:hypothetical protein